jgi:hypothetical protein
VNGKPGVLDFYRVAMELIFSWPQAGCLLISVNARTHRVNQSFLCAAQRDFISLAAAEHNVRMHLIDGKELRLLTHLNLIEFGSTAN